LPVDNLDKKVIRSIQDLGRKYAVEKIVLFGSRARGDNQRTSDIDLAVYPLPDFSSTGKLASDLDDLDTLLKIDVIFINGYVEPSLIENVEKEGVILYERSS